MSLMSGLLKEAAAVTILLIVNIPGLCMRSKRLTSALPWLDALLTRRWY